MDLVDTWTYVSHLPYPMTVIFLQKVCCGKVILMCIQQENLMQK